MYRHGSKRRGGKAKEYALGEILGRFPVLLIHSGISENGCNSMA